MAVYAARREVVRLPQWVDSALAPAVVPALLARRARAANTVRPLPYSWAPRPECVVPMSSLACDLPSAVFNSRRLCFAGPALEKVVLGENGHDDKFAFDNPYFEGDDDIGNKSKFKNVTMGVKSKLRGEN